VTQKPQLQGFVADSGIIQALLRRSAITITVQ
jgi:hypothetical protein